MVFTLSTALSLVVRRYAARVPGVGRAGTGPGQKETSESKIHRDAGTYANAVCSERHAIASCRGFPARRTRNEKPRPFSNGSTVAVTSSTG